MVGRVTDNGTTEIGVGLISVGWMGKLHSRAYQAVPLGLPRAEPAAPGWCTPPTPPPTGSTTPATCSATQRGSLDYRAVLADPDVDVVSICAPNLLHREIGVAAAEAGKPFWIEKPVGRDAIDTAAVAAAAAAGRV